MKTGYTTTINVEHNEKVAKINEDGEVIILGVNKYDRKQPKDRTMMFFESNQPYSRTFTKAWLLLETQTTALEFKVVYKMSLLARAYTNSLEPLSPDSTVRDISEHLSIDKNKVTSIIDKLFKLGVIGKFEVYDRFETHHNYWVFNPYLSFNGKTIKRDVQTLFDNTYYAHC